jgi:hypothetical protein
MDVPVYGSLSNGKSKTLESLLPIGPALSKFQSWIRLSPN